MSEVSSDITRRREVPVGGSTTLDEGEFSITFARKKKKEE